MEKIDKYLFKQIAKKANIEQVASQEKEASNQNISPINSECSICFENKSNQEFTTLSCNHSFCTECLTDLINSALTDKDIARLQCPGTQCKKKIQVQDIQKLIKDRAKLENYYDLATSQSLATDQDIKYCKTPDCGYYFINDQKTKKNITCPKCNKTYCSNCLFAHEQNITCEQAEIERKTTVDKETEEWKKAHTKPCPGCNTPIEKNEGCDYIACTKCKYEFCWQCLCHYPKHIHPEPASHKVI